MLIGTKTAKTELVYCCLNFCQSTKMEKSFSTSIFLTAKYFHEDEDIPHLKHWRTNILDLNIIEQFGENSRKTSSSKKPHNLQELGSYCQEGWINMHNDNISDIVLFLETFKYDRYLSQS